MARETVNGSFTDGILAELRAEIAAQGLSKLTFAERTDYKYERVNKVLNGATDLKLEMAKHFCDALGVSLSDLIDRADQRAQR